MNLQHLLDAIYYQPSLITPTAHASIRELIEARLGIGENVVARQPGKDMCGEAVEVEQAEVINGIMHIPINGAIGMKLDPFQRGEGAVDSLDVANEIEEAEADDEVRGVLFEIDSPGGMVSGTPELAERISEMHKPNIAFTNGMMASAAYWLGSATQAIFSTRTANIGGIGVYMPVFDMSGWYRQRGVTVDLIKAGKLKGLGYPGTSLSESGREHLQARIDEIYAMFKEQVRTGRGQAITDDTMQGQTFLAKEAMQRGLIDGIVADKAAALSYL